MPDVEAARAFLRDSDLVVEAAAVDAAIARLGAEITEACANEYPLLLTVMGGAVMFAGRLLPLLRFPLDIDYLHATRYRGQTSGSGLAWLHRPATPMRGRRVLLADDILDEGHTLLAVKRWCEDQGAQDVRVAVLAVKRHDRRVEGIDADYVGLEVPDRYVFGYGMDYREQGRNLPAIYALAD